MVVADDVVVELELVVVLLLLSLPLPPPGVCSVLEDSLLVLDSVVVDDSVLELLELVVTCPLLL